jgi:hypothetical protein
MNLTWRSRISLWILRQVLTRERTVLTVEFGWNEPASGNREPMMAVVTKIHATDTTLSIVHMRPEQARKLCQTGLETLDRQLGLWQEHWRKQKEGD